MTKKRRKQLEKNAKRLFWMKAFTNLRTINIVLSIFYIARGITVDQIMYLSLFWATGSLLFEVPSSYLADRWGRKKTLMLGIVLYTMSLIVYAGAHGFVWLALGVAFSGMGFACVTGTDEALLYDTEKELGKEKNTLAKLGENRSAKHIFKIVTAIVGSFIAKDLTNDQFIILLLIDIVGMGIAMYFALRLVEANHVMDLEEEEAGVLVDGIALLKDNPRLLRAILSKELLFFSSFILWAFYQTFYVDLGIKITTIGIAWSILHLCIFLFHTYTHKIHRDTPLTKRIDDMNIITTVSAFILMLGVYFFMDLPYFLFTMYLLLGFFEAIRFPLFSELFNKKFKSYNRATTISLANLLHNVLEYPIIFAAGVMIAYDIRTPFVLSFLLGLITVIFFYLYEPQSSRTSS